MAMSSKKPEELPRPAYLAFVPHPVQFAKTRARNVPTTPKTSQDPKKVIQDPKDSQDVSIKSVVVSSYTRPKTRRDSAHLASLGFKPSQAKPTNSIADSISTDPEPHPDQSTNNASGASTTKKLEAPRLAHLALVPIQVSSKRNFKPRQDVTTNTIVGNAPPALKPHQDRPTSPTIGSDPSPSPPLPFKLPQSPSTNDKTGTYYRSRRYPSVDLHIPYPRPLPRQGEAYKNPFVITHIPWFEARQMFPARILSSACRLAHVPNNSFTRDRRSIGVDPPTLFFQDITGGNFWTKVEFPTSCGFSFDVRDRRKGGDTGLKRKAEQEETRRTRSRILNNGGKGRAQQQAQMRVHHDDDENVLFQKEVINVDSSGNDRGKESGEESEDKDDGSDGDEDEDLLDDDGGGSHGILDKDEDESDDEDGELVFQKEVVTVDSSAEDDEDDEDGQDEDDNNSFGVLDEETDEGE